MTAKRAAIKEANPEASFGELGKLVGVAWRALSEVEKAEYKEKASADKERHKREMEDYTSQMNNELDHSSSATTNKASAAKGKSRTRQQTVSAKKTGNSSPEVPRLDDPPRDDPRLVVFPQQVDPAWNETCEAWLARETSHKSNPTVDDILNRKRGYKLPLFRYKGGNPTIKSSWHPVILKKGPDRWSDTRDSIISYSDESLRREFGEHLRLVKKNTNNEIDMVDQNLHVVPITEEV